MGQAPGELAAPPALPGVPSTFDAALDVAEKTNPNLRASQYAEEAARSRVGQARAAYRPTVRSTPASSGSASPSAAR